MTKAKNLADKIDLHLQVNSPGFHLSDDDMRLIAASLRGVDTPDTIALDELLKFASQYDGCTHDSLIQMIHREFEIRRRTNNEEMENYRMALAYISKQSTDQQSRELADTALNAFSADRVPQSPVDLTNHHNALKCPYCNPDGLVLTRPDREGK